jgi:hypothetical protein
MSRKDGRDLREGWAVLPVVEEMVERDAWTTRIAGLVRADADPGELAGDTMPARFTAHASDPDHRIELPSADAAHAAVIAEHARDGIRIAAVCPLVHEGSHSFYVHAWLHGAPAECPFSKKGVVVELTLKLRCKRSAQYAAHLPGCTSIAIGGNRDCFR